MGKLEKLKELASAYKILYVEDDKNVANLLINYLSNFFSEIVYAQDGKEALSLFEKKKFDLVITDIEMPYQNGLELSSKIKEIDSTQHIVITTAYSDFEKLQFSIQTGIEAYLLKPINYSEMNSVLFKMVCSIKKDKDLVSYQEQLEFFVRQLQDKNLQLKQYLEILDHIAIVSKVNLDGVITYVNECLCSITGYKKDELIGKHSDILKHRDVPKSIYVEILEKIKTGTNWNGTMKNTTKNNEVFFTNTTVVPLFGEDNKIEEYMGISFLTTKEELEKREFKKRVMINYQEHKKNVLVYNKKILDLEEKLSLLLNEQKYIKNFNFGLEEKNKRLLGQINYYEKEYLKLENYRQKTIDRIDNRINTLEQGNKDLKSKLQIKEKELNFLKDDVHEKKEKLLKLNEDCIRQQKIISDLKSTIQILIEKEKS